MFYSCKKWLQAQNLSSAFVQFANKDTSVEALLEALFTRILFMPSTVPGFR